MKIWKILILLTGLAGLAGFFLPMTKTADKSFSALDIMRAKTADNAAAITEQVKKVGDTYDASKGMTDKAAADIGERGLNGLKGVVAALFVPALLLTLIGLVGVVRGRFLRLGAIFALLLGLVSAAIWGIFFLASGSAAGSIGIGLHMLLVAGLGGIIGGIGNLISPDGDRATGV
jgi:hypothetical protein